jgi:hypothetical protein
VLANHQKAGKILRTDSKRLTGNAQAEHLAVAILENPGFLEAVFARFLLHEGRGMVLVDSKRVYGSKAGNEMSGWLEKNGPETERALLAWRNIPSRATLNTLPQAAGQRPLAR